MMKSPQCVLGSLLVTVLLGSAVCAETITPPAAAEYGGVFRCEGRGGMDVRVAEGDLRMFV